MDLAGGRVSWGKQGAAAPVPAPPPGTPAPAESERKRDIFKDISLGLQRSWIKTQVRDSVLAQTLAAREHL